jgi:hypothetical protein
MALLYPHNSMPRLSVAYRVRHIYFDVTDLAVTARSSYRVTDLQCRASGINFPHRNIQCLTGQVLILRPIVHIDKTIWFQDTMFRVKKPYWWQ